MTQNQYIINRKLNILELGQTLGNISEACRKLGVSRQHYYDIKQAIEEEWDLQAKMMVTTKRRSQKYARFFREVQRIYPALTTRLALPPGETGEQEFREIGRRARQSQARVSRLIEEMIAAGRSWSWVKIADL